MIIYASISVTEVCSFTSITRFVPYQVCNSITSFPFSPFLLQPLNESGYSIVEFGAPDMFMRCSTKEKVENPNCLFNLKNGDANLHHAGIVWRMPSGRKAHSDLVSAITFVAALFSTLVIVVASLHYSNSRGSKDLKQS